MNTKNLYVSEARSFISESLVSAFKEHKGFLYFCIYFYLLSYLFLSFTIDYSKNEFFSNFFVFFFNSALFSTTVLAIYLAKLLITDRPKESPIKYSYQAICRDIFPEDNRWRIFFAAVGLSFVISAFLIVKVSIPKVVPFSFDTAFEELDRWLHYGYQPWELLQPLLGNEWVTLFLHRLYYFWFPVIYVTFFWQVGSRTDKVLRMQFIFSFVACWAIVGGVMATLLSSAGPIYYDLVIPGSPDTYKLGMDYLQAINNEYGLYMFTIKDQLWEYYVNPVDTGPIKGISAMPSMHVSIAFLLALFGWRKGLYFRIGYSVFAVLIFLGSIHLLWHYAIDGYVSIIATAVIWIICGKFAHALYGKQPGQKLG